MARLTNPVTPSEEEFDSIDRYLAGEMPPPEKQDFETRLAEDPPFKALVEEFGLLLRGVEESTLKEKLADFHQELHPVREVADGKPKLSFFHRFSLVQRAAAASLVFFITLASWWIYRSAHQSDQLFAQYFKPDPGLPTVMGTGENYEFGKAMVDYKRGDYDQAIAQWAILLKQQPQNDTLHYFIGVANLAAGNEAEALPFLQNTLQYPQSVFLQEAYYYLGLLHLKQQNLEQAKEAFQKSNSTKGNAILLELDDKK